MEEISLSHKKGLQKRVDLAPFLANYFFMKNLSENNTYTLEFLKIAFPSAVLTCNFTQSV